MLQRVLPIKTPQDDVGQKLMRTLTLDLLRHGETKAQGIYQGITDVPLSVAGQQQMEVAMSRPVGWQNVLYSPLQRCAQAAIQVAARYGLSCAEMDWLREYDFGDWDGRTLSEVYSEQSERVDAFWRDPANNTPPGGESIAALQQRVLSGRDELLKASDDHLLLVTHGGVIRTLIADCLKLDPARWSHIRLDHAHFTRLRFYCDQTQSWPELVTCNVAQLPSQAL